MSEADQQLVLLPEERRAVVTFARGFLAAVRVWTMYPPEHPTVRTALERLRDALATAIELKVASGITVTPASLLVRGAEIRGDNQVVADMAALLHDRGVLHVAFDPAVSADALARLIGFAARPAAFYEAFGGVAKAWAELGDPAIRLEAVDYGKVLEDREPAQCASRRDDIWRSIVSALSSERRTLDEREQQRLLELVEDPGELAALAEGLIADEGSASGSPVAMSQAEVVLSSFRQVASLASVLSPDRAEAVKRNMAGALVSMDPRLSIEVVMLDAQGADGSPLASALGEEAVAQLLAKALGMDLQATSRLAQVFDLLVPEESRRAVLDRARDISEKSYTGENPFESFWQSTEELLLSYNERSFVTKEYRAVLDGASSSERASSAPVSELDEWLPTVSEDRLRQMSVVLLADLLRLETETERAVALLDHMGELADDLLVGGLYADALRALDVIKEASTRGDLAASVPQVFERVGCSSGILGASEMLGAVPPTEWPALAGCLQRVGVTCLEGLRNHLVAPGESVAATRAGEVFVGFGESAVAPLVSMLDGSSGKVRMRLVALLGRIGAPSALPALQPLLRKPEPALIQAVIQALAGIGDRTAARALHTALVAEDGRFWESIGDALLTLHDRRIVPLLVRLLGEIRPLGADYQVALLLLDALGRLRDARAVRALGAVLFLRGQFLENYLYRGKLRTLKRTAARALRRIGDPSALQALESARRTGDRMLRRIVTREASASAVEGAA